MADTKDKEEQRQGPETLLLARVVVELMWRESFELIPFEDANDVKSKVSELIGDWSKTGFLVRGSMIYPWHQVKLVKATEVIEVLKSEYMQRMEEWNAIEPAHMQQSFWKTKKEKEKKGDDEGKKEEAKK